ncbi:30S ribosomal protein S6 [Helicobacter burdigaliensis]|uniref:30S ribosomal protein S6 n=1 Tax=Helicobacter burdigaliensis TaxID=2315334 RepID=UPI000EF6A657|nr:30S ribosomal protein S6 [Helicobacter burdigaliensis]
MRFYETMFVIKPTLTQEEITQKIDFYKSAILNNGGQISATLDMGMRNLAYEIKKNKRGYYFVIYFKAEPKLVLELERLYRINEDVLRFIVIKYESKKEQKAWEVLVDRAIHNKKGAPLKEVSEKEESKKEDKAEEA